jgi:hypothetical protein
VSYTVFEACLDPERRSCAPGDLSVLLALAAAVNQKDVERGWDWVAWPSQARIAYELGIGERQVRRRLANLKAAGDIRETGEIVGRGIRKYEITVGPRARRPSPPPSPPRSEPSGVETEEDRSDPTTLDHMDRGELDPEMSHDDTGQYVPVDRSDPTARPDHMDRDPGPYGPTEPEGNRNENQEENAEVARAEARDPEPVTHDFVGGLSPLSTGSAGPTPAQLQAERADDLAELAVLEDQRETTSHHETTERSIAELRERLGLDPLEVAA